uniref:Uncharacterized protein n=1 Tax=Romanomermis culicivorax TaxID=13658 RepID=A0A915LCB7_ROMCU
MLVEHRRACSELCLEMLREHAREHAHDPTENLASLLLSMERANGEWDDETASEKNDSDDQIVVHSSSKGESEVRGKNLKKSPIVLNQQYGLKRMWPKKFPQLNVISIIKRKVCCTFCKSKKSDTIWCLSKILHTCRTDAFNYYEQKDKDHARESSTAYKVYCNDTNILSEEKTLAF